MHKCPICGKLTEGKHLPWGVYFAICPECYQREYVDKFKKPKRMEET